MSNDAPRFVVTVIDPMDTENDYIVSNPDVSSMQSTFGTLTVLRIQDIVTGITSFYFIEPGMKIHVVPFKVN